MSDTGILDTTRYDQHHTDIADMTSRNDIYNRYYRLRYQKLIADIDTETDISDYALILLKALQL